MGDLFSSDKKKIVGILNTRGKNFLEKDVGPTNGDPNGRDKEELIRRKPMAQKAQKG